VKTIHEREADVMHIRFGETTATTGQLAGGIAAGYDKDGRLAGIGIMDAGKRPGTPEAFRRVTIEDQPPSRAQEA
jgi:uncharacterized protein YuzE